MGHNERHRHRLTGLSHPAANISGGQKFPFALSGSCQLHMQSRSLQLSSVAFFVFYTHRKPNAVLSLQQASLVLHQEQGLGGDELEDTENNPPPQRQRSCRGCPCHPSLPASELPPSACQKLTAWLRFGGPR